MFRLTSTLHVPEPVPTEQIGQFLGLAIQLAYSSQTSGTWKTPPQSEGEIVENGFTALPQDFTLSLSMGHLWTSAQVEWSQWIYQTASVEESRK